MPFQGHWWRCGDCLAMFFSDSPSMGVCPAGGGHQRGQQYVLPHDVAEDPSAQAAWRFCGKCQAMFFDGFPSKGVCPAGGGHSAAGFTFVLPHDVSGEEPNWRFCDKCHVMFFDGSASNGVCPAGGGHNAQGFNFVLHPGQIMD